jgi:AAA domain
VRILQVTAGSFGGIRDKTLTLSDGLNVVTGPNGAGKSTWHAAMYAALCGHVGGAQPSRADRRFAEDHEPWDGGDWEVSAHVEFADGRRILVSQDLSGRRPSIVTSLDHESRPLAESVSFDGAVDLTTGLGLDRRSFAATAWVEQDRPSTDLDALSDGRTALERAVAEFLGTDDAQDAVHRVGRARRRYLGSVTTPGTPLALAAADVEANTLRVGYLRGQRQREGAVAERLRLARTEAQATERAVRAVAAASAQAAAEEIRTELVELRDGIEPAGGAPAGSGPRASFGRASEPPSIVNTYGGSTVDETFAGETDGFDEELGFAGIPGYGLPAPAFGSGPAYVSVPGYEVAPGPRTAPVMRDHEVHASVTSTAWALDAARDKLAAAEQERRRAESTPEPAGFTASTVAAPGPSSMDSSDTSDRTGGTTGAGTESGVASAEASGGSVRTAVVRTPPAPRVVATTAAIGTDLVFAGGGRGGAPRSAPVRDREARIAFGSGAALLFAGGVVALFAQVGTGLAIALVGVVGMTVAIAYLRRPTRPTPRPAQPRPVRPAAIEAGPTSEWSTVDTAETEPYRPAVPEPEPYQPPTYSFPSAPSFTTPSSFTPSRFTAPEPEPDPGPAPGEPAFRLRDLAQAVSDARWATQQAEIRLAAALSERGFPARRDNVDDRLAAYRVECARLADQAVRNRDRLADLEYRWEQAQRIAQERGAGLEQREIHDQWYADADACARRRDDAAKELAAAERESNAITHDIDAVTGGGEPEQALAAATHQLRRLEELDDALRETEHLLHGAQLRAFDDVRDGIRRELRDLLPTITDQPTLKVEVDRHLRVHLGEAGQRRGGRSRGSHSTVDESTVFTRVALGRHLADGRELGPLLLDDVTSGADKERIYRLLDQLAMLARRRQVVVFAHDPTTKKWAKSRVGRDPYVHLHLARSVHEDVQTFRLLGPDEPHSDHRSVP